MIRATLVRWTARLLLVSLPDVVEWDDVDLQAHVDDDRLADALDWDAIDVYDYVDEDAHLSGPVERLQELEDDDDRAYVWVAETPEAERQLTQLIVDAYREDYGREPRAAHFVVSDLEQLREMDESTVRLVDPAEVTA